MTQSPVNLPAAAAQAGVSKRSWLWVIAHLPAAPAAQAGVFSFSLFFSWEATRIQNGEESNE
jgi:hypothetical protein